MAAALSDGSLTQDSSVLSHSPRFIFCLQEQEINKKKVKPKRSFQYLARPSALPALQTGIGGGYKGGRLGPKEAGRGLRRAELAGWFGRGRIQLWGAGGGRARPEWAALGLWTHVPGLGMVSPALATGRDWGFLAYAGLRKVRGGGPGCRVKLTLLGSFGAMDYDKEQRL